MVLKKNHKKKSLWKRKKLMGKKKSLNTGSTEEATENTQELKTVELSTNEVLMLLLKKFNDVALVLECQHNVLAKQEELLDQISKRLGKRESCT